jgi:hypothetical protein
MANGKDFTNKEFVNNQLQFELASGQRWREPTIYNEPTLESLKRQSKIQFENSTSKQFCSDLIRNPLFDDANSPLSSTLNQLLPAHLISRYDGLYVVKQ